MERVALVVDDTGANRDFLERLLAQARFTVKGAATGKAALEAVANWQTVDLVMLDLKLPDVDGLQLAAVLRQRFPLACIVAATMYDEHSMVEKAFASGCNVFLVKPHGFMELFQRLRTGGTEEIRCGRRLIIDQYGPRAYAAPSDDTLPTTRKLSDDTEPRRPAIAAG